MHRTRLVLSHCFCFSQSVDGEREHAYRRHDGAHEQIRRVAAQCRAHVVATENIGRLRHEYDENWLAHVAERID